jgi:hypothetical protein
MFDMLVTLFPLMVDIVIDRRVIVVRGLVKGEYLAEIAHVGRERPGIQSGG